MFRREVILRNVVLSDDQLSHLVSSRSDFLHPGFVHLVKPHSFSLHPVSLYSYFSQLVSLCPISRQPRCLRPVCSRAFPLHPVCSDPVFTRPAAGRTVSSSSRIQYHSISDSLQPVSCTILATIHYQESWRPVSQHVFVSSLVAFFCIQSQHRLCDRLTLMS